MQRAHHVVAVGVGHGRAPRAGGKTMGQDFRIGEHVRWNSEAGFVTGRIIAVHTQDFDYKGHRHRATPENPQYEIQSDKTEHIAAHRGAVLQRIP